MKNYGMRIFFQKDKLITPTPEKFLDQCELVSKNSSIASDQESIWVSASEVDSKALELAMQEYEKWNGNKSGLGEVVIIQASVMSEKFVALTVVGVFSLRWPVVAKVSR